MDSVTGQLASSGPIVLPVISGTRWFGSEPRPFVLRVEIPLSPGDMVAALYGVVEADEISSDEDLCGSVTVALLIEGLATLEARAAKLHEAEQSGDVESPEFLTLCRERVAALLPR